MTGLEKLEFAASQVSVMQQELKDLQPELIKTSAETEKLMIKIEQDTVEVEAKKEVRCFYTGAVLKYFRNRRKIMFGQTELGCTFTTHWAYSADNILKYFFIFSRKQDLAFHTNCLLGDSLQEMSNLWRQFA